jgi:hypothetical protein
MELNQAGNIGVHGLEAEGFTSLVAEKANSRKKELGSGP